MDYSKMDDNELNEAISKIKGDKILGLDCVEDYINDWRLCGELLEEMGATVSYNPFRKEWWCFCRAGYGSYAPTPLRATAIEYLEWLAWKEQE